MYGQVYMIKNKINNKVYIGQTIRKTILERYNGSLLNTHNAHLKSALELYGEENFEIKTLYWAKTKEELNLKEIEYIKQYNALNDQYGYNKSQGGLGGTHSSEINKKISIAQKRIWEESPDRRKKMSETNSGENNPMHKSKGGHRVESRKKMSETKKQMFANGTLVISEKSKAILRSKEVRRKCSESKSKFIYIQYDKNMNEINRFCLLKDLYEHMKNNNLGLTVASYRGFKNKVCKDKIFHEEGFCGYYYKMIKKEDYANTEVSWNLKASNHRNA